MNQIFASAATSSCWELVIGAVFVAALIYAIVAWSKHNSKKFLEVPSSGEFVTTDEELAPTSSDVTEEAPDEGGNEENEPMDDVDRLSLSNMGNEGGNE